MGRSGGGGLGALVGLMLVALSACTQPRGDYSLIKNKIASEHHRLSAAYINPKLNRDSVVLVAQTFLFRTMITDVFPAWYGTKWAYHGTTEEPRTGKIACGYFVTTTLRDLGFNIPRVRWAQLPSESMILEMTSGRAIKRYRYANISLVEKDIIKWGDGLYVVGLDNHTGYIVNLKGRCRFVHSDYFNPEGGVISESFSEDTPLKTSNYRVVAKLLSPEMVKKWLRNERFP